MSLPSRDPSKSGYSQTHAKLPRDKQLQEPVLGFVKAWG